MLVVRHRASGWVREIARKDEDAHIEADFEPESGVVTVFEGRREFKALERAARRAGSPRRACASTSPTGCSRSRSLRTPSTPGRRSGSSSAGSPASGPTDPAEYAAAVRHEAPGAPPPRARQADAGLPRRGGLRRPRPHRARAPRRSFPAALAAGGLSDYTHDLSPAVGPRPQGGGTCQHDRGGSAAFLWWICRFWPVAAFRLRMSLPARPSSRPSCCARCSARSAPGQAPAARPIARR